MKTKKNIIELNRNYLKENYYNISSINGELYELYCYNKILDCNYKNINIIKSKKAKEGKFGNLEYSKNGKILCVSNNIALAEYDILGIKSNTIYWWEVTKHAKIENDFILKTKIKYELLKKLFKYYDIEFKLIAPKIYSKLAEFAIEIIKEPLYEYYNKKIKISNNIKNAMSLKTLSEKCNKYDYINDVIKMSLEYYDNMKKDIIDNEIIIKRIYNLKTINSNCVEYFDLQKKKNKIQFINKNILNTDREIFNNRIIQEIVEIKKKLILHITRLSDLLF
ncbi:MAG: hypothetical protein FWD78_10365 [Treponema sp.]|nr:hypothetical protein [Treponema sp.]